MASSPDQSDMSWEETKAPIIYSAPPTSNTNNNTNKRTFIHYLSDHPAPQTVPIQPPPYRIQGYQAYTQWLPDGYTEGYVQRITVTSLMSLCGFLRIAAKQVRDSTKRRIIQANPTIRRRMPRYFRHFLGQETLVPITPPKPRSPYRMPCSYPISPAQPEVSTPPRPQFEVPYLSPSPSPAVTTPPRPQFEVPYLSPSPSPAVTTPPRPQFEISHLSPFPSPAVATPFASAIADYVYPDTPSLSGISSVSASPSPSPLPKVSSPKPTPYHVRELRELLIQYGPNQQHLRNKRVPSPSQHHTNSRKPTGLSMKKSSPLSEKPSKVNTRARWPSPSKKTVSFPDSPVTRTKRFVVGEMISHPSPGSSFDENSILSMAPSPEAQWISPTQDEQQRFLEDQMMNSPITPVRRKLFASPNTSASPSPSAGDNNASYITHAFEQPPIASPSSSPADGDATSRTSADGDDTSRAPTDGDDTSRAPTDGDDTSRAPTDRDDTSRTPTDGDDTSHTPTDGDDTSSRMTPSEPQGDPERSSGDETEVSDTSEEATPTDSTRLTPLEPQGDPDQSSGDDGVTTLFNDIAIVDTKKKQLPLRRGAQRTTKKETKAEKLRAAKAAKIATEKLRIEEAEAANRAEVEKRADEERATKEKARQRRMPIQGVIQPLSAEWEAKINIALAKPTKHLVATSSTATPISRRDIGHVLPQAGAGDDPRGWLNDEIINACLQAVVKHGHETRNVRRGQTPKLHAFNPFFWTNLKEHGPEKVSRWATKAKIGKKALLNVDHVFIPVNRSGNHWTLLVVSPVARTVEFFDSMHGDATEPITKIQAWLAHELGSAYLPDEWDVLEDPQLPGQGKGPRQSNMSDCGVFAITNAKMVSLGVDPMAISARDMPLQRKRIVAELLNGRLDGDFEPRIVFS